jgi:predicted fused transcriptional regulator/phosphomethylpyrimidine kinase
VNLDTRRGSIAKERNMARIILCPDFEHFTHLSRGILRAMQFSADHG